MSESRKAVRHNPSKPSNRWPALTEQQAVTHLIKNISINEGGCWLWHGNKNRAGYGEVSIRNNRWMVHRYMYTVFIGEIPQGMHACHYCDVRNCINPSHLWLGTHKQNMADCRAKGRYHYTNLTHCKRGHEFNTQNTIIIKTPGPSFGLRGCRACQRARLRIKAGWPKNLAYSLPPVPHGYKRPSVPTSDG